MTSETAFPRGERPIGIVTPLHPDQPTGSLMAGLMANLFGRLGLRALRVNPVTAADVAGNVRSGVLECLEAGACGIVLSAVYYTEVEAMAAVMRELLDPLRIPFVCILYRTTAAPVSHVYYDNRDAGAQAASHLLSRGWTELRFIEPYRADWSYERLLGVRDVAALHPYAFVALGPGEAESELLGEEEQRETAYRLGRELFQDMLGSGESQPARMGIVAANDSTAYGVMRAGEEFSRKPGRDYAIVGFDDDAASASIGLTSLRPPWTGMAESAVTLLGEHLAGNAARREIKLKPVLISRKSTVSRFEEADH